MLKRFFILLTFGLLSSVASASQPGQSYVRILETLIGQGLTQIGGLDIREVKSAGQKIDWQTFSHNNPPSFAQGRKSAYFIRQKQKVFVSESVLTSYAPNILGVLELHEVLGVLGYSEGNYQISSSLEILSRMKTGPEKTYIIEELENRYFSEANLRLSGSGSSVGGGGDIVALIAKIEVLDHLMKSGKRLTPQFWAAYPGLAFEPHQDRKFKFVGLQYKVDPISPNAKRGKKINAVETIRIYVPVLEWSRGKRAQAPLVKTIIEYVTSLYPVYADTPKAQVSALSCNTSKTVLFPKAQNAQILTIQQARVALILGCQHMMYISEIRIPSFENFEDKQKTVIRETEMASLTGVRNHDCELKIGGHPFPFQADLQLGKNAAAGFVTANASRRGHEIADTLIQAYVVGNEQGRITTFFVKEGKVNPSKVLVQYQKTFSQKQKTTLKMKTYAGETMVLSCQESKRGRP